MKIIIMNFEADFIFLITYLLLDVFIRSKVSAMMKEISDSKRQFFQILLIVVVRAIKDLKTVTINWGLKNILVVSEL